MISCRLSIDVQVFSVCGHHFSGWSIETYLCDLQLLNFDMYFVYFYFYCETCDYWAVVCILANCLFE
jgi:hypothetical protein